MRWNGITLIVATTLALGGCGSTNREIAKLAGSTERCVDGVIYLQFPSGVSVKYKKDGSVATC